MNTSEDTPSHGAEPSQADLELLDRAISLARAARDRGDHPFGALLLAPDGTIVEAMNTVNTEHDPTGHAETNLVRLSARKLGAGALAASTLYTSTEPCAMCTGAIYWSGIGRVVYALSEKDLASIVTEQSGVPTLDLPCRDVLAHGGSNVTVVGPILLPEATEVHRGFWH
jgi:tRNA(Arg) A34 adenosine deaminase TadA